MAADDIVVMLTQLATHPDDHALRGRIATALDDLGRHDEAASLLASLVNLTGHDDDAELPCLCKRCLAAAGRTAAAHDMSFVRSFAIVGTRVLHFWMLADQERERARVRGSVVTALQARLAAAKERA